MRRLASIAVTVILAVAACSSSATPAAPTASDTQAASAQPSSPATDSQASAANGGDCTGFSTAGTYQGKESQTFCGPAKATVKIGATTYEISGGQCFYDANAGFAVSIGTQVIGMNNIPADGPQYFGVISQPGSEAVAIGFMGGRTFGVKDGSGRDSVTIAPDHKSGGATGSDLTRAAVTATFTC